MIPQNSSSDQAHTIAQRRVTASPKAVAPVPRRQRALPLSPALRTQQAVALKRRISQHMEGLLDVAITDNRSVMLSVHRDPPHRRYRLRAHHIFIDAPTHIVEALAAYAERNDRRASQQLGKFIEDNDHRVAGPAPERAPVVRTNGSAHDLALLFDELNHKYFDGRVDATITWGRNAARQKERRSIRLGSYTVEENLIRIHPGLDQHWIPRHYVQWVIFHEMLHAVHPIPMVNGRRCFHTPAFAADEQRFEHYGSARNWEQKNVAALLRI